MKFQKKAGGRLFQFKFYLSIEFEYQNSGYSHNSMGQVHLLFPLLISNLSNEFDWDL